MTKIERHVDLSVREEDYPLIYMFSVKTPYGFSGDNNLKITYMSEFRPQMTTTI